MFLVVGLGNPGEKYKNTRHNVGWIVLDKFWKEFGFDNWSESSNPKAYYSNGKVEKKRVEIIRPLTMMNGSGKAVSYASNKHKIKSENIIVVHDDLDLPLGKFKIVYNRGSGGHNGVKSIKRALGTNEFVRIKVGVSPSTPSGKVRKPKGEDKVLKFLLGKFNKKEEGALKRLSKDISGALESIVLDGRELAQTDWN